MRQILSLVCAVALAGSGTLFGVASAGAATKSAGERKHTSALGYSLPTPAAFTVVVEPAPADTPADRAQEAVVLQQGGVGVVRVEVWRNPKKWTLQAWFDAEMGFLLVNGAQLGKARATRKAVPALVLDTPRSPQSYARRLLFFAVGPLLVRATCENVSDAAALAALGTVQAGFDLTRGAP